MPLKLPVSFCYISSLNCQTVSVQYLKNKRLMFFIILGSTLFPRFFFHLDSSRARILCSVIIKRQHLTIALDFIDNFLYSTKHTDVLKKQNKREAHNMPKIYTENIKAFTHLLRIQVITRPLSKHSSLCLFPYSLC